MNRSMKTVFRIQVFFIFLVFLITAAGCSSTRKVSVMPAMQSNIDIKPKEHTVVVAETRTLNKFLNVNTLIAYDDIEELSFKIDNCNLKAIYVNNNDLVEEGQLLAELDASDLEYQVAARQNDLKRVQLMYDKILNGSDIDPVDLNFELECLKLDMESIELDIAYIKKLISKTQLLAPFSGVITDIRGAEPGTTIQAYDKVITIWKPGSIKLSSEILNSNNTDGNIDFSGIVTGMKVALIYDSKDERTEIPATITKIINTDPGVQDDPNRILSVSPPFQIYVKPDKIDADKLKVDHKVILSIHTGKLENVIVLPKSVIRGSGKDHIVKVVKGDKITNRNITTGYEDNDEKVVVVTSGLRPGESILLD